MLPQIGRGLPRVPLKRHARDSISFPPHATMRT
jgi:hypothetical protein